MEKINDWKNYVTKKIFWEVSQFIYIYIKNENRKSNDEIQGKNTSNQETQNYKYIQTARI